MSASPKHRQCILGVFTGVYRQCVNGIQSRSRIVVKVRCGRWDCAHCGPLKAKRVFKRAMNGEIAQAAQRAGFRSYEIKLLTLTYGGKGERAGSTPKEAAVEMQEGWAKLRKEIRYHFGEFHFLKVFETHKDGWPHLHVVICGANIVPVQVLGEITRLWRYKYGFGFVRLNWCSSPQQALRYLLKYLFKCPAQFTQIRLFSASEGALLGVPKKPDREYEWRRMLWRDSGKTYRECERELSKLGELDCLLDVEVFPIEGCPF